MAHDNLKNDKKLFEIFVFEVKLPI